MSKRIFITATDTETGKAYTAAGLLRSARERGLTAIGFKPVASGCELHNGRLINQDAMLLQHSSSISLEDNIINPIRFMKPIAPHIAASEQNVILTSKMLLQHTQLIFDIHADIYIVEGFGGWHAPLNSQETMADFAVKLNCEIVFVVGLRLGCLNHALLTEQAIQASGAACKGWIANHIDPDMLYQHENITALKDLLKTPHLGTIQYGASAAEALKDHIIF
jgi:dethiobiotin synthetase